MVKVNEETTLPWGRLWLKCVASVDHGVPTAAAPVAPIRDVFGMCFRSQEQGCCGEGTGIVTGTQVLS